MIIQRYTTIGQPYVMPQLRKTQFDIYPVVCIVDLLPVYIILTQFLTFGRRLIQSI